MPSPHIPFATFSCRYDPASIARAAAFIRAGQCVGVPTETVYGLAANARDSDAVAAIYAAKGRPSFNPLIVHVADRAQAEEIAAFNNVARLLADRFWPGPLTLVLPLLQTGNISPLATAGLPTIALRMPAHPAMRDLIVESGCPLAAPSANRSGAISPTCAEHVMTSLQGRIAMVIDGGPTEQGLESTIVAPVPEGLRLLRHGPVTSEMLTEATGVPLVESDHSAIQAPGQLASHYAPDKPLRLNVVQAEADEYWIGFGAIGASQAHENLSVSGDMAEAAANLFAALYRADASAQPRIAIAPVPSSGLGSAINDRLRRAAY